MNSERLKVRMGEKTFRFFDKDDKEVRVGTLVRREGRTIVFKFPENNKEYCYRYGRIIEDARNDETSGNLFSYYSKLAEKFGVIKAKNDNERDTKLIDKYKHLKFISPESILAKYIKGSSADLAITDCNETVIFPFACNASQMKAVSNIFNNRVSIIEGPPGTGKTQTILNIIANIIMRNKTVMVVSDNNEATYNVFEKLQKNGYEHIVAKLGSASNKKNFIKQEQTKYPNFSADMLSKEDTKRLTKEVGQLQNMLNAIFAKQNKLIRSKQYLSSLKIEQQYFAERFAAFFNDIPSVINLEVSTAELFQLWTRSDFLLQNDKGVNFWFKLKNMRIAGFKSFTIFKEKIEQIIPSLQKKFYELEIAKTEVLIETLQKELEQINFHAKVNELVEKSGKLFKGKLAEKYSRNKERPHFTEDDLWKKQKSILAEYPVIISTTFSAVTCLKGVMYDYIIFDEASQIGLMTGLLSLAITKNIVVVGDLKQLPNIIDHKHKKEMKKLAEEMSVAMKYRHDQHSLLASISSVFPEVPKTLLNEHYRCHPKIIGFCNQKFYNNQLIIMTKDKGEEDTLGVTVTTYGKRDHNNVNLVQAKEIKEKILPELKVTNANDEDIGIISPFNKQNAKLIEELNAEYEIDISTIHKFQGKEKKDIIISTVQDEFSEFVDNPNMINVAVSRAKNRLRIVVPANKKNINTNIGDLVKYIDYNKFEIKKGTIYSCFDLLYGCYNDSRKKYLAKHKKVSPYNSENFMNTTITKVLQLKQFASLCVAAHQTLQELIGADEFLSEDERNYVTNKRTHIDFVIFNKFDKKPVLAIEVDGCTFHQKGTKQSKRDEMKNDLLNRYNIPLIRFRTDGAGKFFSVEQVTVKKMDAEEKKKCSPAVSKSAYNKGATNIKRGPCVEEVTLIKILAKMLKERK